MFRGCIHIQVLFLRLRRRSHSKAITSVRNQAGHWILTWLGLTQSVSTEVRENKSYQMTWQPISCIKLWKTLFSSLHTNKNEVCNIFQDFKTYTPINEVTVTIRAPGSHECFEDGAQNSWFLHYVGTPGYLPSTRHTRHKLPKMVTIQWYTWIESCGIRELTGLSEGWKGNRNSGWWLYVGKVIFPGRK